MSEQAAGPGDQHEHAQTGQAYPRVQSGPPVQQPGYPSVYPPAQPPAQQPVYQQPVQQFGYQQPYAQPVYQHTMVYAAYQPQPKAFSVTSLVLGLASILFGFTFLVPIGAVVFGIIGIKREPAMRGMSITGLIVGSLFLLGWVILVVFWIVFAVILASAAASVSTYGS